MLSSATQQPPRQRHNFLVSAITFEGFNLRSSNLTHTLLIQIYRTSSIIDIVVPSKKSDASIWNGQKCDQKLFSDIQNGRSIWNGQKCDQKLFSDIQNGRRQPFWQKNSKQNKFAYRSEISRNVIESKFRISKMADGSHYVKNCKKNKSCISIWNDQKCVRKWISDIQNGRRQPFCPKFKTKIKLCIDLKYPEMWSKVKFGHPKWPTAAIMSKISKKKLHIDLKWPEMRAKVNFGHPKLAPAAILSKI